MGRTLCIILHYGSEDDTFLCLDSLIHEECVDIVVSDNDPDQRLVIPERFSGFVQLVRTGGVAGFAQGNNIAATKYLNSSHDAVLIINNDTIVQRGAIRLLRETLSREDVGAVGPCMPYASVPDKIWACGGYINRLTLRIGSLTKIFPSEPFDVDYLPGAAILCRAHVWCHLNGLSERYFLAYEEAEFALEVKRLGFKVLVNPNAIILHKVGMSSQPRPEYFYNSVRNRITFAKYLYGSTLGFLIGVLVTFTGNGGRSLKIMRIRLSLWSQAVVDECKNVKLDRERLMCIADEYSSRT